MNKTYKYTLTAHEKKEISFDTGVARLAVANGDGVDGSTTVVMSEITKQHSGDLVSFIDGADAPFADFIVNIKAVQSGSGDPSPTNVRPISEWTGANVYVSDEDTSNPTTYNIDWQSTAGMVGNGTIAPLTGVLAVTAIVKKFRNMNWTASSSDQTKFYASFTPIYYGGKGNKFKCSMLKNDGDGNAERGYYGAENTFRYWNSNYTSEIYVKTDTNYASIEDFLAVFGDADFYYELATSVTYQLTPTEIRSLLGVNNVWADCGPVNVRYFVQSTQPMIDYIDDKTENVVKVFKATGHYGGTYTLDDVTCDELCTYARDHSNIVIKATRASSAIAYDIFILSDYIGTSATFRNAIITTAIGGGHVLEVRELQADNGNSTNALTVRYININADSDS